MRLRHKIVLPLLGLAVLSAASLALSRTVPPEAGREGEGLSLLPHGVPGEDEASLRPHAGEGRELRDCHNPHTSDHGKLLAEDVSKICLKCHGGIVPGKAKSVHKAVVEGNCVKCHDPHAAKYRNNLALDGNELCFSCHKGIAESVKGPSSGTSRWRRGASAATGRTPPRGRGPPQDRGTRPLHQLSQDGRPLLRETAHELPGGQIPVHLLSRPPRVEPGGDPMEKRPFPRGEEDVQPVPPGPPVPGRAQG